MMTLSGEIVSKDDSYFNKMIKKAKEANEKMRTRLMVHLEGKGLG